jgi:hypothetical protein
MHQQNAGQKDIIQLINLRKYGKLKMYGNATNKSQLYA